MDLTAYIGATVSLFAGCGIELLVGALLVLGR